MTPQGVRTRRWTTTIPLAFTVCVGLLGSSIPASAASEDVERATTIVRMLRFVALPTVDPGRGLTIAVVGNATLAAALRDASTAHQPGGRTVNVVHVASPRALADVDASVVVLGPGAAALARQLLEQGILTVGDGQCPDPDGGLVLNLMADGERYRFSANPSAAARAGVVLSSRLLRLAHIAN